jgi:PKD domain
MGIWGSTDPAYLKRVHDAAVQAVEQAAAAARPAELWAGSGSIRSLIEQNVQGTDHLDGWKVDDTLPVLWARKPGSGATLAIYANVPVHPDQFRGVKYGQLSADYPGNVRDRLHAALGGTAVIGEATLGRQETIGSIDDYSEVERQGTFITNAIERALAGARPVHGHKIGAREQLFQTTVTNSDLILLVRLNALIGFFCVPDMTNPDICSIDRSVDSPYLTADGSKVGTWVATARIGNLVYTTEPGEAFPEVAAAIRRSIHGARAVNVVGMSEDQLGYFFPSDTYSDAQMATSDFQRFNVGPELPDQTVAAAASNARALGFAARPETVTAEAFDPDAFHKAGVQFYPEIVESDRATVSFLATARASQDGTPGRTVSPIAWDFGDGTGGPSPNGDGQWFDHTFPGPGTYHVTAAVTDQDGAPRSWTQTVIVDPPLRATVRAHPRGSDVVLSAGAKGGDGGLLAAHWSFPDGSTADGLTVTQPRGEESGEIEVEVVDGAGNQASLVFRLHHGAVVALQRRAG